MKVALSLFAALLAIVAVPGVSADPIFSDRVILSNPQGPYGVLDVSITDDSEGPTFIGGLAVSGSRFDVFLTEPGTNIISDHLYSIGDADNFFCNTGTEGDCVYFASDASLDSFIGTTCTEGQVCTEETGQLQDVTGLILLQTGGICCGGPIFVQVQSTLPEPGSLLLLGSGLAAIGGAIRRRTQTMRKRTPE